MTPAQFWDHVQRGEATECWPWTGAVGSEGYGTVGGGSSKRLAHRVAYELANGDIPPGYVIRHMCVDRSKRRVEGGPIAERLCCNPGHLQAGTQRENRADRSRHGRDRIGGKPQGRRWW